MNYFGTLFDKNYLTRGLALRHSLRNSGNPFVLYVLCLDRDTYEFFEKDGSTDTVQILLDDIEKAYPQLREAKGNRNWAEYIFTLSPFWPRFLLEHFENIPYIATLDADVYFFSDPAPIFDLLQKHDILVTPHRFHEDLHHKLVYGRYNVGFQVFKRTEVAFACLNRWGSQCIAWCYDRKEKTRFADQKYLDEWQELYQSAFGEIDHIGAGIAPWNMKNMEVTRIKKELFVNGQRVIFVHFHLLRFISFHLINPGLHEYHVQPATSLIKYLYGPYIHRVQYFMEQLGARQDRMARNQKKQGRMQALKLFMKGRAWYVTSLGVCVGMIRGKSVHLPKLISY